MILLKGSQDVLVPLGVAKIRLVDDTVGYLLGELERAGLLAAMNVLVVSDHGMAVQNNTMYLSDVVDETLIDRARSVINVVSSIYGKTPADVCRFDLIFISIFIANIGQGKVEYQNIK